jgi:TP901 family phage tail tape measure protein
MGLGLTVTAKDATQGVFENVQNKLAQTHDAVERISAVEVSNKLKELAGKLKEVGGAALEGLHSAWEQASHFNKGIAETSTLIDESKFAQKDMNDLVLKMANEYGQDLQSETKSLYQAISSGATNAASAQNILTAANRLAEAGVTDTTTALTGLTKVLNNYGMDFSKANDVSDAFFVAVKGGQTTVGELGTYIGDLAAGASNAGVKMEELVGALGTGSTLMRDTGAAATGLKAALANVASPTADATAEAARLGIQFNATSLRAKGLVGFLESITTSANFNKDTMSKLFGSMEATNAITALTGNNMGALKQMMDDMAHKAGGTQAAFDKLSQTTERLHAQLTEKLVVAMVKIGEIFDPIAEVLLKFAQQAVDMFNDLPEPLRKGIVLIVAIGAAGIAFMGIVVGLAAAILGLGAAIDFGLLPALGAAAAIMIPLVPIIAAVGIALVGLKTAYDKNLGGIADKIKGWVTSIKLAFEGIGQMFENGEISGPLADDLSKAENRGILKFISTIFMWGSRLEHFFDGIKEGFDNVMKTLGPTFQSISDGLDKILQTLGLVTNKTDDGQSSWQKWGHAGAVIGVVIGKIFEYLVDVVDDFVHFFSGVVQGFHKAVPSTKGFQQAIDHLGDALKKIGVALGIVDEKNQDSSNGFESFGKVIGWWAGGAVRVITTVINSVAAIIGIISIGISTLMAMWHVITTVSGAVMGFAESVGTHLGNAFKTMRDMAMPYLEEIKAFIEALIAKVKMVIDTVSDAKAQITGKSDAGPGGKPTSTHSIGGGLLGHLGGAQPSVAGAEAQSQQGGALHKLAAIAGSSSASGPGGAIQSVTHIALHLDGEKLADITSKNQGRSGARKLLPF